MTTVLLLALWVAALASLAQFARVRPAALSRARRFLRLGLAGPAAALFFHPTLALAATTDLQTATESGSAVIMYVCGVLVAIGIVTAGVAMMLGRQSIAKWALGGALIAGLAFPIVKTLWGNVGIQAPDVSTFTSGG